MGRSKGFRLVAADTRVGASENMTLEDRLDGSGPYLAARIKELEDEVGPKGDVVVVVFGASHFDLHAPGMQAYLGDRITTIDINQNDVKYYPNEKQKLGRGMAGIPTGNIKEEDPYLSDPDLVVNPRAR